MVSCRNDYKGTVIIIITIISGCSNFSKKDKKKFYFGIAVLILDSEKNEGTIFNILFEKSYDFSIQKYNVRCT